MTPQCTSEWGDVTTESRDGIFRRTIDIAIESRINVFLIASFTDMQVEELGKNRAKEGQSSGHHGEQIAPAQFTDAGAIKVGGSAVVPHEGTVEA